MLDDILKKASESESAQKKISNKIRRIASSFFQELSYGADVGIITVTDAKVTRGKYYTRVWVSFSKLDETNGKLFQKFLTSCEGQFKKYLSSRLDAFKIPDIEFILDETSLHVKKISKLLS